jgi:hypothetical protein
VAGLPASVLTRIVLRLAQVSGVVAIVLDGSRACKRVRMLQEGA